MDRIEIRAANVAQVHRTRVGKNILIDDDVQGIARDLADIDKTLKLEYDPGQELYIVFQAVTNSDGSVEERLVSTWDCEANGPIDKRLVNRIREISAEGYDYVAELDRIDAAAKRAEEHEFEETFGPVAEKLAWALVRDLDGGKPVSVSKGLR